MGIITDSKIEQFQQQSGIQPVVPEKERILKSAQDQALELIRVIELERSGIRDGDGFWHGSDVLQHVADDITEIISDYQTGSSIIETERDRCLEADSRKPATWLLQFDGFNESPLEDFESPDYYSHSQYELANAPWDVRLSVAPGTTLEVAQTLTQGLAEWVNRLTPEEYGELRGTPPHGPEIEAPKAPQPTAFPDDDFDENPF